MYPNLMYFNHIRIVRNSTDTNIGTKYLFMRINDGYRYYLVGYPIVDE
jgi:hypothetical protein